MTGGNLALHVASCADVSATKDDVDALEAAEGDDRGNVGAVVMSRDADGKVDVLEVGDDSAAAGAWIGGIGLVVGLFAPPLLASTAIGAGIGALLGHFTKKHEETGLGAELDEYFPASSSAVVVIDDTYLDRVQAASTQAHENICKAIDRDDYDELAKAISESAPDVDDAVDSSHDTEWRLGNARAADRTTSEMAATSAGEEERWVR